MKIAIVSPEPSGLLCDKLAWVAEAFVDGGHEVRRIHDYRDIPQADAEYDCLLFDHKSAGTNHNNIAELGKDRKAIWVQWWRDLVATAPKFPLDKQPNMVAYGKVMRAMDVVLVKERSLLDEYAKAGINALWFDQACPRSMPACEHRDGPEWDVLVVGHCDYYQRRADARELAKAGYRVAFVGLPGEEVASPSCESIPWHHPLKALPRLVSKAAVVLGVDYRTDLPGYTSDRSYLVAGMGGCYIARVDDYGTNTVHGSPAAQVAAWVYDCNESLLNVVNVAMNNPEQRKNRGEAARKLVMQSHTYHNRISELSEIIGQLQARRSQTIAQHAGMTC